METLSLAVPLVLFEKSRLWAGGFTFSLHPTQHNYTTQTVTLTVTLTSTFSSTLTDTRPTRNVVCPSGAWFENKPHLTPSIHLVWNPKRIIVQLVGIGTHFYSEIRQNTYAGVAPSCMNGLHYTNSYTYSHPNLNFLQHCTDTLPTRNVVCPSGEWFENRPH